MLEDYFRRQNMAKLLKYKIEENLTDETRKAIIKCIADYMVEALVNGDPTKIEKRHKIQTAQTAVALFVGLKSKIGDDPLVNIWNGTVWVTNFLIVSRLC